MTGKSALEITRLETSALSSDDHSWLRVMVWLPPAGYTRRAVVQLVHSVAEHMGRYDSFARFLAGLGYVVFGHDHIGHGKSVATADELGCMPLEGGKDILIEDITIAQQAALRASGAGEGLPQFLFGHSLGSYIVRAYIARQAAGLDGVVLCATGNQRSAAVQAVHAFARFMGSVRGADYRSRLLEGACARALAPAIKDARTDCDWISTDPAVVDAYRADPLTGFMLSAGAVATLTDLVAEVVTPASAAALPPDLPLLFIAGAEDPLSAGGAEVKKAAELYKNQGVKNVRTIIYPDMRHEILSEPRREDVYCDVEAWFTERMVMRAVRPS